MRWYREGTDGRSIYNVAYLQDVGLVPGGRPGAVLDGYRESARLGCYHAAVALVQWYFVGRGGRVDHEAAARWAEQAIRRPGDTYGRHVLAAMFFRGQGVERAPARAADLWREAAELGAPEAMLGYGQLLVLGDGVKADPEEGLAVGRRLEDPAGRGVLLRGVNAGLQRDPFVAPHTAEDVARLVARTGADFVRFYVAWGAMEPRPLQYDEAYLDRVVAALRRWTDAGVRPGRHAPGRLGRAVRRPWGPRLGGARARRLGRRPPRRAPRAGPVPPPAGLPLVRGLLVRRDRLGDRARPPGALLPGLGPPARAMWPCGRRSPHGRGRAPRGRPGAPREGGCYARTMRRLLPLLCLGTLLAWPARARGTSRRWTRVRRPAR